MSMCNRCGRRFNTAKDIEIHSNFCDDEPLEHSTTPSYREYLEKAAKKDPIYNIYLLRTDMGTPDNAWNPLEGKKKEVSEC